MIDQQKVDVWKKSIEDFVINDIRFAVGNGKLETGLIILTCAAVDCVGDYFAGEEGNQAHFKEFVREYFPESYKLHVDDIWQLRNGLVHDHVIDDRFIANRDPHEAAQHLKPCRYKGKDRLWFNRYAFARDFLEAWEKYAALVSSDQDTFAKMDKRAHKFGYLQVIDIECE